jgi:hypothetical protein
VQDIGEDGAPVLKMSEQVTVEKVINIHLTFRSSSMERSTDNKGSTEAKAWQGPQGEEQQEVCPDVVKGGGQSPSLDGKQGNNQRRYPRSTRAGRHSCHDKNILVVFLNLKWNKLLYFSLPPLTVKEILCRQLTNMFTIFKESCYIVFILQD